MYDPGEHALACPEEIQYCEEFGGKEILNEQRRREQGKNYRCALCPLDEGELASKSAIEKHARERYAS